MSCVELIQTLALGCGALLSTFGRASSKKKSAIRFLAFSENKIEHGKCPQKQFKGGRAKIWKQRQ